MSIFKSTLKPVIASQLKAREKVISSDTRSSDFLRYTTGKNSWVRMVSFVNYDSKKYDSKTGKLTDDGKYNGDTLSKKYILEGGTLYNQGSNQYSLRAGVGNLDGVYASNIDKRGNKEVDRLYGLRPMPGITNISVMNKSAYGSLREATIQFYAWDKHQLEELEVLFMRTGYTVLLEWGWSEYIDHETTTNINDTPIIKGVKNFDNLTINPFQPGLTDETIYNKIDKDIEKNKGNYDALLGFVKNFSWQLMPNGGFQCSTTLISRGEVIETIKVSSNSDATLTPQPAVNGLPEDSPKPIYSNFEKIFLNIIGHINESEFVNNFVYNGSSLGEISGALYISGSTTDQQKELRTQADQTYKEIETRINENTYYFVKGPWDNYTIEPNGGNLLLSDNTVIKFCDGKTEGTGIEYISMNAFIAILNEFFIYKDKNTGKSIVNLVLPFSTPCLASVDSVSIDPTACIIQNSQATFITDQTDGFTPQLITEANTAGLSGTTSISQQVIIPEFLAGPTNIGQIGNIYVSISKIIQLYRSLASNPDGANILTLLQELLDACSFALGGINDFKLYTEKNIVQIIDTKYFENAKPDSKFKFDLIGLKSICRDVKINSRIFSEQSTMIAIGAGSSNQQSNNLGDIYSSTQTYFNIGLTDRIISNITLDDQTTPKTLEEQQKAIFDNIQSLTSYINRNVLGLEINGFKITRVPQENEIVNAGSLLKSFHYQINGNDVDFKALIPFELEITLDGIGGLVIGQIFTIDKSILPKDYYNKNLGFIITGISHSLQNNDWITNIKTQICLLDNSNIADRVTINKDNLKKLIQAGRKISSQNGYLFCAITDFMVRQYINVISDSSLSISKELVDDFSSNLSAIKTDKDKMKQVLGNIKTTDLASYLKVWYGKVSTTDITKPNFPATFDEFMTPSKSGVFDLNATYQSIQKLLLSESPGLSVYNVSREENPSSEDLNNAWLETFFGKIERDTSSSFTVPYKESEGSFTIEGIKDPNYGLNSNFYTMKTGLSTKAAPGFFGTPSFEVSFSTNYSFEFDSFYSPSTSLFRVFYSYLLKDSNSGVPNPLLSTFGAPSLSESGTNSFSIIHLEKVK